MYEDLIYHIETMIADADKDPQGLMKMRKLVDILNSGSKAAACQKIMLLKRKAGHAHQEWDEKCEAALAEMRNDLRQLKKLLDKPAESTV